MKNDLIRRQAAIDVDGLDEEIRCEMCTNPMHNDRGCDGNCRYNEKLYDKIIQLIDRRITQLPSAQPEIIRCKDCKHRDDDDFCTGRGYPNALVPDDGFCDKGERRE